MTDLIIVAGDGLGLAAVLLAVGEGLGRGVASLTGEGVPTAGVILGTAAVLPGAVLPDCQISAKLSRVISTSIVLFPALVGSAGSAMLLPLIAICAN